MAAVMDIPLTRAMISQAWAEGEQRNAEAFRGGYVFHGSRRDYCASAWGNVQGRCAELAFERWVGLPLLPKPGRTYREEKLHHFDTNDPWCVQVRGRSDPRSPLYVNADKNDCLDCPWILAIVHDVLSVDLIGWATGHEVKDFGQMITWSSGHRSWSLPQSNLRPMPGPTVLHARMFHRGMHSICPHGRH